MKTLKVMMAMVLVLAMAGSTLAQGGRGGGGQGRGGMRMGMMGGGMNPAMLLNRADVAADLKLTDDQKSKLEALQEESRNAMREAFQNAGGGGDREAMRAMMEKMQTESTKKVNAILTADQQKRLKQIGIQMSGTRAIMNKEIAKELGITADQQAKIDALNAKQMEANQALMQQMRDQAIEREDAMARMRKNGEALDAELAKILTDAQKAKMKEMAGPKFERKDEDQA